MKPSSGKVSLPEIQGVNQFTAPVQDYPRGFPQISRFLDSDDAFMVYRRFGTVYSRLLLSKQDEMSNMEDLLLAMDKTDRDNNNEQYLKSRQKDINRGNDIPSAWQGQSRIQLIEKLEKLALEYGKHIPQPSPELLTDMPKRNCSSRLRV